MYAGINGLRMFYEIRGTAGPAGVPVVLLHGAISAIGTSFGPLPDLLAQTRQVIAVEQQGHGRTADTGRPMPVQAMHCEPPQSHTSRVLSGSSPVRGLGGDARARPWVMIRLPVADEIPVHRRAGE